MFSIPEVNNEGKVINWELTISKLKEKVDLANKEGMLFSEFATDADFDEVTDCECDEYGWHDVSYPELIEDSVDCKIVGLQVMDVVKNYGDFNKEAFERNFKNWINESHQNFQESGEFYDAVIEEIKNNN